MYQLIGLLTTVISVLQILIIIRILLSYFPTIDPYNPFVRILRAIVDPILAPFRRILPTFGGIDFSPLLAILVLYELSNLLVTIELGTVSPAFAFLDLVRQLVLAIIFFFGVVLLIRVVLSLFNADPWHPIVMMIRRLTDPLVRPFRGIAPASGNADVAAVIAFFVVVAIYFVARGLLNQLVSLGLR